MRVLVFASKRAFRFAIPAVLTVVLVVAAILASPRAMAAVQDAAASCNQTVRTVVTKLRKNTPTGATLARWAAWGVKHPDWHPSKNAKLRPRFVKTSKVAYRNVKIACETGPSGKLTGTLVPVEESLLPDGFLEPVPMEDLTAAPVLFSGLNPIIPTGWVGPSYPPIIPVGGVGPSGGTPTGGTPALPPAVPELPSVFLALTGVLLAVETSRRRHIGSRKPGNA